MVKINKNQNGLGIKVSKIKFFIVVLWLVAMVVYPPMRTMASSNLKTMVVFVEGLDFDTVTSLLKGDNGSVGLMHLKTKKFLGIDNEKSYYMTLAFGRPITIKEGHGLTLYKESTGLSVKGYEAILKESQEKYVDFSWEMPNLSSTLMDQGIDVGYIGDDASGLFVADLNGQIKFGEKKLQYQIDQLRQQKERLFRAVDVGVLSFDLNGRTGRLELLKTLIREHDGPVFILPKTVPPKLAKKMNRTLAPALYYGPDGNGGLLYSGATKRLGIITSLDIAPTITSLYGDSPKIFIGASIKASHKEAPAKRIQQAFKTTLNLNLIKYVLHGVVIGIQLFLFFLLMKKETLNLLIVKALLDRMILGIFLSFLLGLFKIEEHLFLYFIILLLTTEISYRFIVSHDGDIFWPIAIMTNGIMLGLTFLAPSYLYQTFIGYNNLLAGGRFYGFNNEAMGILLATSLLTYYKVRGSMQNKLSGWLFCITYFSGITLAMTKGYGANVGGYLTSVLVFFMVISLERSGKKVSWRRFVGYVSIGGLFILWNAYFDMTSDVPSHLGKWLRRVEALGYGEIIYMIGVKLRQVIFMLIVPPWSFVFVAQMITLYKLFRGKGRLIKAFKIEKPWLYRGTTTLLGCGFSILLLNDTGVVAYTYIFIYLVRLLLYSYQ